MRRRLHTFVKDFLMIRLISVQSGGNTVTLSGDVSFETSMRRKQRSFGPCCVLVHLDLNFIGV